MFLGINWKVSKNSGNITKKLLFLTIKPSPLLWFVINAELSDRAQGIANVEQLTQA